MEWAAFMHDDFELKPSHLGNMGQKKININNVVSKGNFSNVLDPVNFALPDGGLTLESYVNEIVRRALEMHKGNKTETARYLDISRSSLYCHLKRLGK